MTTQTRAFVMGHPVKHSRSPMVHGFWLTGLDIAGSYETVDVAPADLGAFFAGYDEAGWVGGNVTVPHKTAVIPFLDRIDDEAKAIGAVNTIWREGDALVGGNTDAIGFLGNLDDRAPGWGKDAKTAIVLGAGGAARATIHGLTRRGLSVAICNRTLAKAEDLSRYFGQRVTAQPMEALPELMQTADLLVNTTSLGMIGQPPLDIDLAPLKTTAIVYDIVYVPLETALIKAAAARGLRTVDGLGMLLHQAVPGFAHWFGKTPRVTDELRQLVADDVAAKTPGA